MSDIVEQVATTVLGENPLPTRDTHQLLLAELLIVGAVRARETSTVRGWRGRPTPCASSGTGTLFRMVSAVKAAEARQLLKALPDYPFFPVHGPGTELQSN